MQESDVDHTKNVTTLAGHMDKRKTNLSNGGM